MCSIGKKHRDARSLAATLEENGFPVNSSVTLSFATELLERLPSTGSTPSKGGASAYKMKEKEAARAARKNEGYGLLLDDEEDEAAELERAMDKARSRADKKKKKKKRDRTENGEDAPDGAEAGAGAGDGAGARVEDKDENGESPPRRLTDAEEKAEFERRLKERDLKATKKLVEQRLSKEELEDIERRKRAEKAGDKSQAVNDLRKASRREYLKKREEAKLEELEQAIEDERQLFEGEELTEKERAELEYKQRVLDLAKARKQQLEELEHDDAYHMPTAYDDGGEGAAEKRYGVLKKKYEDGAADNDQTVRSLRKRSRSPPHAPIHAPPHDPHTPAHILAGLGSARDAGEGADCSCGDPRRGQGQEDQREGVRLCVRGSDRFHRRFIHEGGQRGSDGRGDERGAALARAGGAGGRQAVGL